MDEVVEFPLPSSCKDNGFTADESWFLENILLDESVDGTIPEPKIGLNGLPNRDGIGRISPPLEGNLDDPTGVLVEDSFLPLVAKSRADASDEWLFWVSRHTNGGGHNGFLSCFFSGWEAPIQVAAVKF